jgi:hypothetical protein
MKQLTQTEILSVNVSGGMTGLETIMFSSFAGAGFGLLGGIFMGNEQIAYGEFIGTFVGTPTGFVTGLALSAGVLAMNLNVNPDMVAFGGICAASIMGAVATKVMIGQSR